MVKHIPVVICILVTLMLAPAFSECLAGGWVAGPKTEEGMAMRMKRAEKKAVSREKLREKSARKQAVKERNREKTKTKENTL